MRDIERFLDRVVDAELDVPKNRATKGNDLVASARGGEQAFLPPEGGGGANNASLIRGILRRWYFVLIIFVLVTVIGLPAVFLLIEPGFVVSGNLRISSSQPNLLTGEPQHSSRYGNLQTQAMLILSPEISGDVADQLKDEEMEFFTKRHDTVSKVLEKFGVFRKTEGDPAITLQEAINSGNISAVVIRGTEVLSVSMKSMNEEEAKKIVNAFMDNYKRYIQEAGKYQTNSDLTLLIKERDEVKTRMNLTSQKISDLANQIGGGATSAEDELQARRVAILFERLNNVQAQLISAGIEKEKLEDSLEGDVNEPISPTEKKQYINADQEMAQLSNRILAIEQELIVLGSSHKKGHPEITQNEKILKEFEKKKEKLEVELGKKFDELIQQQHADQRDKLRQDLETEIRMLEIEKQSLTTQLEDQEKEKKEIGTHILDIEEKRIQRRIDQDQYDAIVRRIRAMEFDLRREHVTVDITSLARKRSYEDKRVKMAGGVVFGGLGLGIGLTFLLSKRDKRIWTVDEVQHYVPMPVLGTITQADFKRRPTSAGELISDFQNVRTNLSLMTHTGIPKRITVVSASTQDGKTTFCVNLATSLAGSGKRVLLIDGDLRRPSVLRTMGLNGSMDRCRRGGESGFDYSIHSIAATGLDVLVPEVRCMADPFELISSPLLHDRLVTLSEQYDHVIIDTPPVLAFPDALVLAEIAGTALVVGFAGRTLGPDIAEVTTRLQKADIHVVGMILNNVVSDQNNSRYGYGYYHNKDNYGGGMKLGRKQLEPSLAKSEA